jgi:hypothetical protein
METKGSLTREIIGRIPFSCFLFRGGDWQEKNVSRAMVGLAKMTFNAVEMVQGGKRAPLGLRF